MNEFVEYVASTCVVCEEERGSAPQFYHKPESQGHLSITRLQLRVRTSLINNFPHYSTWETEGWKLSAW